jgi:hypothetical protein
MARKDIRRRGLREAAGWLENNGMCKCRRKLPLIALLTLQLPPQPYPRIRIKIKWNVHICILWSESNSTLLIISPFMISNKKADAVNPGIT